MLLRPFFTRYGIILAGYLIIVATASGILWWQLAQTDQSSRLHARQRAQETAQGYADYAAYNMTLIDQLIRSIRHTYEQDGSDGIESFLVDEESTTRPVEYFTFADKQGHAHSVGKAKRMLADLSDRPHFLVHQGVKNDDLYIGPPVIARMNKQWVIPVTRGIHQANGTMGGMIAAAVSPDLFSRYYDQEKIGPNGVVQLVGEDHLIRARGSAEGITHLGETTDASPLWPALGQSANGTYDGISPLDGKWRYYGYSRVKGYPLIAIVGLAATDLAAESALTKHQLWTVFALAIILATAVLLLLASQRKADLDLAEARLRSAQTLRQMFQQSTLGMARVSQDGHYLEANPAFLSIVGYDLETLKSLTFWDITPRSYHAQEAETIKSLQENGHFDYYEKEYRRSNGQLVPVRLHGQVIAGEDKQNYIWAIVEDISARRAAEAETRLAASVFHNTAEAIIITDVAGLILSVNPAFTRITGYEAEEVVGQTPRILKSDHHGPAFYEDLWHCLEENGEWQGQIWNRRKDGEAFLAWQTISAVRADDGSVLRFVSVFNDITDLHRKDEQIRHQAFHDALTGLPNRLLLQDRLGHALEIAHRHGGKLALMFIDLDRFKIINDSLGHDIGDLLLIEVAARLSACLRRSDTIARLGGDEFVVVASDIEGVHEVTEIAEKIIGHLMQPMLLKESEVQIGASIGIALYPKDGETITTLMKNADVAMYRSKSSGRNTYRFFDPASDGQAAERLNLETGLRRALDRNEFQLYYQPKVDLLTGDLAGAEALIRWNSPERGLVPPDEFIPLAEETGLILRIGDWVLNEACRQIAQWRETGQPVVRIAVNVSARQFADPDFSVHLAAMLNRHGLGPSCLEIELTESAVMANPEQAIGQIRQLQDLGVLVSIDDFGTGYSSLSHLKRLPLNAIKVDRSFVRGVHTDANNSAIVAAVLALADALGKNTIAEGVETLEEEDHLRAAGCPVAQGYRYSPPLPAADFIDWLKTAQSHQT